MAKITIWGYVTACDPGINHFESYSGTIEVEDIKPDMDLKSIVKNLWWQREISPKFAKLTFKGMHDEGAMFHYGVNDVLVKYGDTKYLYKVGLSYAYAELEIQVEK